MGFGVRGLTFCGALLLAPAILQGQSQSFEVGIDAALNVHLGDRTTTRTSIPNESVRFGLFVLDRISVEPSLALTVIDGQNSDPTATVSGWISVLYHVTPDRTRPQLFVRPTAGVEYYTFDSNSGSRLKAGGYLGLKVPVANHLAVRLETGYVRGFESESFQPGDEIALSVGVSLFVP